MTSLVGTYELAKANWFTVTEPGQGVDNLARWKLAHPGVAIGPRTYNFQLTSPSTFVPTNDTSAQITAHNIGVSGGRAVTGGYDFLWRGNYVSTEYTVNDINGIPIPNGKLYYAGNSTNFDTVPLSPDPSINRNYAELISSADLDSTIVNLVNGNSYTLNVQPSSVSNFGLTRYPVGTINGTASGTTPTFSATSGDVILVGLSYIINGSSSGLALSWNSLSLSQGGGTTIGIGGGDTLVGVWYTRMVSSSGTSGVTITIPGTISRYAATVTRIAGTAQFIGISTATSGTTANAVDTRPNPNVNPLYLQSFIAVNGNFTDTHGTPMNDVPNEGQSDGSGTTLWCAESYNISNSTPGSWTFRRNGITTPTSWVYCVFTVD